MRIVPATPADYSIIESVARRTWPVTFGAILSTAQIDYMLGLMYRREAMEAQVKKGHVFHLLLDETDEKTGTYSGEAHQSYRAVAYISHQLDYLPGTAKIHKLYVLPEVQGRGFGRELLTHVEKIVRRAGQHSLQLDVNYQNKATDFYERLGFTKIGRHNTDIGNGYLMEDWQMKKAIMPTRNPPDTR